MSVSQVPFLLKMKWKSSLTFEWWISRKKNREWWYRKKRKGRAFQAKSYPYFSSYSRGFKASWYYIRTYCSMYLGEESWWLFPEKPLYSIYKLTFRWNDCSGKFLTAENFIMRKVSQEVRSNMSVSKHSACFCVSSFQRYTQKKYIYISTFFTSASFIY